MTVCKQCRAELPPKTKVCPACGKSQGGGRTLLMLGLGCVGLLVLLCVIGVLVAIFVPNLIKYGGAMEKNRQSIAQAQMKEISAGLETYQLDVGAYPILSVNPKTDYDLVDVTELEEALVPDYLDALPIQDPWKHPYQYASSAKGDSYILLCTGSDGKRKIQKIPDHATVVSCFQDDLLLVDGEFLLEPGPDVQDCGQEKSH